MDTVQQLSEALQHGKTKDVLALIDQGLAEGTPAQRLLDDGLLHGMGLLGVRFKNNEVFVPEVLIAARALNKGTQVLKPLLIQAGVEPKGKAVIGTVQGDLHDIGKNLVKMMLEGAGFEVVDLGVDVPDATFVGTIASEHPDMVCLSALLTTTMGQQKLVIDAIEAAGLRDKVKVLVGGAPVTQGFADEIGADGYAPDAASAAELAVSLLGEAA